ncbi:MAG: 50S ribosomal protein L4 [Acidimicrobiaceae bacterium]|nr:50S ribosomal protein L4 [Acidimicrobiaceae bacterium]
MSFAQSERELVKVSVTKRNQKGEDLGTIDLDPEIFGHQPNVSLLHQVVTAQLAAARAGTQSTKTRSEVSGGGAKPFRQKGTGRARQGSIRAPHYSGGGVALGPKPRKYTQKTPKKMVRLALLQALSDRAQSDAVMVVDAWSFPNIKTKDAVAVLKALELAGRVLIVVDPYDYNTVRSFANIPQVQLLDVDELNVYDILKSDVVVFTENVLPGAGGEFDGEGAMVEVVFQADESDGGEV